MTATRAAETDPATPPDADVGALEVVPARHPGRWIGSALVLLLLAQIVHGFITNPAWDWPVFVYYLFEPSVLAALVTTLQLTAVAAVGGAAGGVVLAVMRLSGSPVLQAVSWSFVWIFRAIPLIVQLLFWGSLAYLYPRIAIGLPVGPSFGEVPTQDLVPAFTAALIGLTLHEAAYAAEIVRGGILSVDQGQTQAAHALGIPRLRQLRRIVLPQAMRSILPNAANELINLLKGTSVVYVLAIGELFYQVQVIYGRNTRVIPLLMVATVWYVVLISLLSIVQHRVERRYAKGSLR